MIQVTGNDVNAIQNAISLLEDEINRLRNSVPQDVVMNVDEESDPIPHGYGVGMSDDNTVMPSDGSYGWVGVNVGPTAQPGGQITVRGGAPAQLLLNIEESPRAGSLVYFDQRSPGVFTTNMQGFNVPAIGIIYDASSYRTDRTVMALINSNFANPAT